MKVRAGMRAMARVRVRVRVRVRARVGVRLRQASLGRVWVLLLVLEPGMLAARCSWANSLRSCRVGMRICEG